MQFNREMAYYAKCIVDDVAEGKKTPKEALLEMKREQRSLLDQGVELARRGAGAIAGALQIASGAGVCYVSAMTLCAVAGIPLMAHGANNIYENGRNLWDGRSDAEGPVRKSYQEVAKVLGKSVHEGNIAYGAVDVGLSLYGLKRLVLKSDAWRLFRYVRSDYVRAYKTMGIGGVGYEVYINVETGAQIYKEVKE